MKSTNSNTRDVSSIPQNHVHTSLFLDELKTLPLKATVMMVSPVFFAKVFCFVVVLWFMVMGITSLYPNVASVQNNRYLPSTGGGASESIADSAELLRRLDDAFREFQALKDNNIEMKKIISHYISSNKNKIGRASCRERV